MTGVVTWSEATGWTCSVHGGPMFNLTGPDPDPDGPAPQCGACVTPYAPARPGQTQFSLPDNRDRDAPRVHGRVLTDVEVTSLSLDAEPGPYGGVIEPVCPECAQGKCVNCTGDVLTDDDTFEPCAHRAAGIHP